MTISFDISYEKELKNPRVEVCNFKDPESQKLFLEETTKNQLSRCFKPNCNVEENSRRFEKTFTRLVHKCFNKVRVRRKIVDVIGEKLKILDKMKVENQDIKAIESLEG